MKSVIIFVALLMSAGTFAADAPKKAEGKQAADEPSTELREKMAASHERLALCLRSDKKIEECHNEMREQCQDANEGYGCFMMGRKGMRPWKFSGPKEKK